MKTFLRRLHEPVGGEPGAWLYRLHATAIVLFGLKTYASAPWDLWIAPGAWVLHGLCAACAVLWFLGPRPWLLAVIGLLGVRAMVSNHLPDEPLLWFPAVEWPLFVVIPLCGVVLRSEAGVRGAFQLGSAAALGFAGLHKLNGDYFDPVVTCNRLSERLSEWWHLPTAAHAWVTPLVVVVFELGAPFLLLAAPRLGVVFALILLGHFTMIGATALSLVIAVGVLAFLDADDLAAIRSRPWLVVFGLPGVLASAALYRGPWSWPQYGATHGLFAILLAAAVWRLSQAGPGRFRVPREPLLLLVALGWLVNGLLPYTGLKFQYSFSMLANLRLDDDRHNSFVFPAAVRLTDHDPYVHVESAAYIDRRGRVRQRDVRSGLYTPEELRRHRELAEGVGEKLRLRGTYAGRPVTEADLDALPAAPLFQKHLTRGRPQECVH
jgi:hypothetical protein